MRGREDERVAAARATHAAGRFSEARWILAPVVDEGDASWNGVAEFRVHGLVSHHFLRDYAWTIDFARMTMTFVPPAPG